MRPRLADTHIYTCGDSWVLLVFPETNDEPPLHLELGGLSYTRDVERSVTIRTQLRETT